MNYNDSVTISKHIQSTNPHQYEDISISFHCTASITIAREEAECESKRKREREGEVKLSP